jgi:hypothetical protein
MSNCSTLGQLFLEGWESDSKFSRTGTGPPDPDGVSEDLRLLLSFVLTSKALSLDTSVQWDCPTQVSYSHQVYNFWMTFLYLHFNSQIFI